MLDQHEPSLVWEPKRIVPAYAVPVEDIHGQLTGEPAASASESPDHAPGAERDAAAFRPFDADLDGYALLDFDVFDAWYREDERNVGHPRDPFHRIDIVHSSRQVRVETGGELIAESSDPCLLFEPPLPVRYFLPPEDVRRDLLRPSDTKTLCAYKGQASYWSLEGEDDLVWSYPEPCATRPR